MEEARGGSRRGHCGEQHACALQSCRVPQSLAWPRRHPSMPKLLLGSFITEGSLSAAQVSQAEIAAAVAEAVEGDRERLLRDRCRASPFPADMHAASDSVRMRRPASAQVMEEGF